MKANAGVRGTDRESRVNQMSLYPSCDIKIRSRWMHFTKWVGWLNQDARFSFGCMNNGKIEIKFHSATNSLPRVKNAPNPSKYGWASYRYQMEALATIVIHILDEQKCIDAKSKRIFNRNNKYMRSQMIKFTVQYTWVLKINAYKIILFKILNAWNGKNQSVSLHSIFCSFARLKTHGTDKNCLQVSWPFQLTSGSSAKRS